MRLRSQKGITLIEALASTVILGIVIIAFVNISNYSFLASKKSDKDTSVQRIAEEQLNLVRDHILRHNGALPTLPVVNGYTVTVQQTDFVTGASPAPYSTTGFGARNYSVQGFILVNKIPKLLTVTLSWSDTP